MYDVLVNLLPTFLGFAGFVVYHRYFVDRSGPPPPQQGKGFSEAPFPEPEDSAAADVDSEPEPSPEPDSEPTSKATESSLEASRKPSVESASRPEAPRAAPARETARTGLGRGSRMLILAAYVAITAVVFAHFCIEPAAEEALAGVAAISDEVDEAQKEAELAENREKAELPTWAQSGQAPDAVLPNEGQLLTVALTRQFMTLKNKEGQVIYYKSAYWGILSVGTPPEPFKVVFDTGSGHLILPSSYCSSVTCKAHKRYKRRFSTSAKDIDHDGAIVEPGNPRDQITVSFGTGEVSGVFVDDIVCVERSALPPPREVIADVVAKLEGLPAGEQGSESSSANTEQVAVVDDGEPLEPGCFRLRVVLATEMSEDPFKDFHFDGVLGLGLHPLSQAYEFNFPAMVTGLARKFDAPAAHEFSVFLARHEGETSELSIGGRARSRQGGPMHWSPVVMPEHGHWMLGIKNVYVDGEKMEFCRDGTCRAVADTGTSLLAIPSASFAEMYELLRHNAPVEGFCNDAGPALQFEMEGNFTITMRPEDYASLEPMRTPKNSTRDWFKRFFYAKGWPHVEHVQEKFRRDVYCKPLLMSMDLPAPIGPKLFILGEPLLRRYYTVYNTKDMTIGWSQAAHTPKVDEPVRMDEADEWWEAED